MPAKISASTVEFEAPVVTPASDIKATYVGQTVQCDVLLEQAKVVGLWLERNYPPGIPEKPSRENGILSDVRPDVQEDLRPARTIV